MLEEGLETTHLDSPRYLLAGGARNVWPPRRDFVLAPLDPFPRSGLKSQIFVEVFAKNTQLCLL